MPTVRVKQMEAVSVYSAELENHITLVPGTPFDAKDPIVKAYAWAFESDIESATARPGEKRIVRRTAPIADDGE